MDELRDYVEKLFSDRKETSETADLKEEILSNMIAKKNDLVSQGMSEDEAIRKAKESLPSLEGLLEEKRPRPLKKTKRLRRNLIILAAAFFVFFLFLWILAIRYSAQPAQDPANWNAPTHDIFTIVDYRSAYVGDISNVAGLYQHLPMGNIEKNTSLIPIPAPWSSTIWSPPGISGRKKCGRIWCITPLPPWLPSTIWLL